MTDRLVRDLNAPPQDVLAEALVLRGFLVRPHLIGQYDDLAALLWHVPHRLLWSAMQGVYHASGGTRETGSFTVAFYRTLRTTHPDQWQRLAALLDDVVEDEARWCSIRSESRERPLTTQFHGFDWWYARLERCAQARDLVAAAQEQAERAWREDVEGAVSVAQRAAGTVRLADAVAAAGYEV